VQCSSTLIAFLIPKACDCNGVVINVRAEICDAGLTEEFAPPLRGNAMCVGYGLCPLLRHQSGNRWKSLKEFFRSDEPRNEEEMSEERRERVQEEISSTAFRQRSVSELYGGTAAEMLLLEKKQLQNHHTGNGKGVQGS